jgi:hypothetical protein
MSTRNRNIPEASAVIESAPTALSAEEVAPIVHTRRLNVVIQQSLMSCAVGGPNVTRWQVSPNQVDQAWADSDAHEEGAKATDLSMVTIKSIKLRDAYSDFPVPLGVNINLVKGMEITDSGERFAFTICPNTHHTTQLGLYNGAPDNDKRIEWMKLYGQYNDSNVHSKNVLKIENQSHVFVDKNHPVVSVLKANPELLGAPLEDHKLIDNQWYKVHLDAHNACCDTIRQRILSRISTHDLRSLQVDIKRCDTASGDWTEMTESLQHSLNADPDLLKKPCRFNARLEIKYSVIPSTTTATLE